MNFLKQYEDVTLYETRLTHKEYETEIRRIIIEEHCRGKWCLCVDIDEFFDYPYSDRLKLNKFIRYLNINHYTAVVAYMLDMFAKDYQFLSEKIKEELQTKYCYYDTSKINKENYFKFSYVYSNFNRLSNNKIKFYYGGIRRNHFKTANNSFWLIKHPLIFIDHKIEAISNPHYCNKAYIADISCILKHYKFISSFKKRVEQSMKSDSDYDFFTKKEFTAYNSILKDTDKLNMYSNKAEKYTNINHLIKKRFITVSKKYLKFIDTN